MSELKIGDVVSSVEGRRARLVIDPTAPASRRWCCIKTAPHAESEVEQEISKIGFLVYVPRFTVRVRERSKHRAEHDVARPLLPRYLFSAINPVQDPWGEIERVRGVDTILRTGDWPGLVSNKEIERMQAAEGANFGIALKRDRAHLSKLKPGDAVRVAGGPFEGFLGSLADLDERGRLSAWLDVFGRITRVSFDDPSHIEGAD